jgi:hypothetical protein
MRPTVTCNIGRKGGPVPGHRYTSRDALLDSVEVIGSLFMAFQPRNGRAPWPDSAVA